MNKEISIKLHVYSTVNKQVNEDEVVNRLTKLLEDNSFEFQVYESKEEEATN